MSINNVVLNPSLSPPFETAAEERLVFSTRTTRQSLQISGPHVTVKASDGHVYLTNKRLVYVTGQQGDISTFSVDLQLAPALQLSHEIKVPWFGANSWKFMFYSTKQPPIASDGFPKNEHYTGSITFSDGGLFEFAEAFDRILNDVVNNREVDEELPRYTE